MDNFIKTCSKLEDIITYKFKNKELLVQALVHKSFINEYKLSKNDSNERLEFLGDAVLEFWISNYLYENMNKNDEGDMSKRRSEMVCEKSLYFCAKNIMLGDYVLLSNGEDINNGRDKPSILSDAFEALIAAIYLDSGIDTAGEFIKNFVIKPLDNMTIYTDYKSRLQELVFKKKLDKVEYKIISENGPEHNKIFDCECYINNIMIAQGKGKTIKDAEQEAAREAMNIIKARG